MTKNFDLLEEVYDYIVAFPDEWDQGTFANDCGTAFCFAGTAALTAHPDYVLEVFGPDGPDPGVTTGYMLDRTCTRVMGFIADIATEDLCLTTSETERLFKFNNDLPTIRGLLNRWRVEAGLVAR